MIIASYPLSKFKGDVYNFYLKYIEKRQSISERATPYIFIASEHGVIFYEIGYGIIENGKIFCYVEDQYKELKNKLLFYLEQFNNDTSI